MSCSLATSAALPKATLDDYVWEVLPVDEGPWRGDECEDSDNVPYQKCLERAIEEHENQLIQKWQISDKVVREKDTLYVKVPNRKHPLTFRDYQDSKYEDTSFSYDLGRYDPAQKLLFLNKQLWETSDTVLVDLMTGFSQEFEGSDLTLSPNKQYAITIETYPTAEALMMWERQQDGHYQQVDFTEASYQKYIDVVRSKPVPEQMESKETLSYAYYLVAYYIQDKDLAKAKDYAQQAVNLNPDYAPANELNNMLLKK